MSGTNPWLVVPVGAALGVLVGMIGTSGAILIPTLIFVFGLSQLRAQGTSLFIAMLPVWVFPAVPYMRAGNVQWRLGLLLAAGLAFGSYFGARWAQHLPVGIVRKVFALVLASVAVKLFVQR